MKAIIATILTFLFILISLSGCGSNDEPYIIIDNEEEERIIKIGILTSAASDVRGIKYAHFKAPAVEIAGIVHDVLLITPDDIQEEEEEPLSAAWFFVDKGVSLVISSCNSSATEMMEYAPFRQAGIAVIGISPAISGVAPTSNRYFGIYSLDPSMGQVLAALAKERFNPEIAYVLANREDIRSIEIAAYFMENFDRENIIYEVFPAGTYDFGPYIASAKAAGAQIMLAAAPGEYAALIIGQMQAQGLNIPIFSGDGWSAAVSAAGLGEGIELYITTLYIEGGAPQFDSGFRAWAGSNADITDIIITGYDAYNAALEAFILAESAEPNAVFSALSGLSFSSSISGQITFSRGGNVRRSTGFIKFFNAQTREWEFVVQ